MSFVKKCIEDSLPVWEKCLAAPFLIGIADGSLDDELLKGYIVDDSLYLREYAKVFGWGIIHAKTMDEVRKFQSLLSFVNESEDATRLMYLKKFGLTDEGIQRLPLRKENRAYIDTMLQAAKDGGSAVYCMMACLPCMLSYLWIFRELLRRNPEAANGRFYPLICDYANDAYAELCSEWIAFTDTLCAGLSETELRRCMEIFRKCSEHEYDFWLMSGMPRDDV